MKNSFPYNSSASRRRDASEPEAAVSSGEAEHWQLGGSDGGYPAGDSEVLPAVDHDPFVPEAGYVMGRSTKVLVGVLLLAAGGFGGSVVQKQVDLGDRAARMSNLQGPGAGTGAGAGTPTPGPGRRNGGTGTGGAPAGGPGTGGAGSGAPTGAPTQAAGQ